MLAFFLNLFENLIRIYLLVLDDMAVNNEMCVVTSSISINYRLSTHRGRVTYMSVRKCTRTSRSVLCLAKKKQYERTQSRALQYAVV